MKKQAPRSATLGRLFSSCKGVRGNLPALYKQLRTDFKEFATYTRLSMALFRLTSQDFQALHLKFPHR